MFPFHTVEHIVPAQHVREYPNALLDSQDTVLQLHVKQYIPIDNPNPQPGDITIIAAHANGFPKELYEPLWEDLLARSKSHNFRIRSIWIADVAHQGASGVLNESLLGNDPGWNDHARDLLHFINLKRDLMPRPLIGVGHSMGGHNLANLALMHPRLFTTLILLDPVISSHASTPSASGPNPAQLSTFRRDVWPSRSAAATSFQSSPFYRRWDPRVLSRWIQFGLRPLPTSIHPLPPITSASDSTPVTLTTPKHQEVFTFLRPNYAGHGTSPSRPIPRRTHADLNPAMPTISPFYRGESIAIFLRLPSLRPSVLYVFGADSDVGTPELCAEKMAVTGVGVGGSGGEKEGRVRSVLYEGVGHLIAMEAVSRTAEDTATWIAAEMRRWRADEEERKVEWEARGRRERQMVDQQWEREIGGPPRKGKKDGETKL